MWIHIWKTIFKRFIICYTAFLIKQIYLLYNWAILMIGIFSYEKIVPIRMIRKKYKIFQKIPHYNPTSFEMEPFQDNPNINKNLSFKAEAAAIKYSLFCH